MENLDRFREMLLTAAINAFIEKHMEQATKRLDRDPDLSMAVSTMEETKTIILAVVKVMSTYSYEEASPVLRENVNKIMAMWQTMYESFDVIDKIRQLQNALDSSKADQN